MSRVASSLFCLSSALLVALLLFHGCSDYSEAASVREDVVNPVVTIEFEKGHSHGSGVAVRVGEEVLVLTARHVVYDALTGSRRMFRFGGVVDTAYDPRPPSIWIQTRSGHYTTGQVVWLTESDDGVDLALVKPDTTDHLTPAVVAEREPEEGDEVWYCGHGGRLWNLGRTTVNGVTNQYLVVNPETIWYGHSGGGVFTSKEPRRLVGVIVRFHQVPRENPRSPMLCERRIKEFLSSYEGKGK